MKKLFALLAIATLVAFAAPAFAANPFADVPMNHWAYDAVAQLAANGIVVGYPDGSYKGPQAATRYELAAVVARALANVDMNKASKQDLEMLKKLVVEFKSELDALGVKVDKLDARVALLEERIGGWKFSGNFRFTMKWADDSNYWGVDDDSNWTVDRFRWNITKYVDDKVTVVARYQGGASGSDLMYAYAMVNFPWDMTAKFGRFPLDWEGDFYAYDHAGYNMNDAYVTDYDPLNAAVWFKKPFEMGSFEMFIAHQEGGESWDPELNWDTIFSWVHGIDYPEVCWQYMPDNYIYGARLAFDFNENLHFAANYVKYDYANDFAGVCVFPVNNDGWELVHEDFGGNIDFSTLWGDLVVNFNENITFKGQYFVQDLGDGWMYDWYTDDSPSAWKAILQVSQDALKFTDLWIEYAQLDEGFLFANGDPYAWALSGSLFLDGGRVDDDTTVLNVVAKQKWNDQWWTYVRYLDVKVDEWRGDADYYNWTASVRYNYTPNMWFELGYDKLGGDGATKTGDDMVWFRTTVNF